MELVVPIYQWPAPLAGSMYEQVATSSARSTTIINPGNGLANQCQGSLPLDPVWRPVVTLFDSNPLARTIGYVYSQWGSHSLAVVKQSIDNYFACFDVAGIFVDETATDPSKCNGNDAYYDQLYAYVKSKDPSAEVMCNPGTGGILDKSGSDKRQQGMLKAALIPVYGRFQASTMSLGSTAVIGQWLSKCR